MEMVSSIIRLDQNTNSFLPTNQREYYIGIDNGVTGSIAVLHNGKLSGWQLTPTIDKAHYSKTKGRILRRVDYHMLYQILLPYVGKGFVLYENPYVNPINIGTSVNAAMSFNTTELVLEHLGIPHDNIAAPTWQRVLLGSYGTDKDTKKAGIDKAVKLFPGLKLPKGADADAILIAEYARRVGL